MNSPISRSCLVTLVSLLFIFNSCKKENVGIIFHLSPTLLEFNEDAGKVITFHINASSDHPFRKLIVTSKLDNSFTQTELDSVLDPVKNLDIVYEYLLKNSNADYTQVLTFKLIDLDGNSSDNSRRIYVKVNSQPLQETAGFVMYSKNSGNADAYDLVANTPLFSGLSADDVKDLQNSSDEDLTDALSKSWISPGGAKFVKFNGFDYVNATKSSVAEAYNAGTKLNKVTDLQSDDIIIAKLGRSGNDQYRAIKVMFVIDSTGSTKDRYVFNVKE